MSTALTRRLLLVAILLCAAPPPPARAEGLADVADAAVERFAQRIDELAQWCEAQELYAGRDTCYRMLVLYRPDHEIARRTLRYTKKAGDWVQSPGYKPGTDRNEEMAPKFRPWLDEITSEFLTTLLEAVRPVPEWEDRDGRKRVLGEILRLDPDHEEARSLNGEASHRGRWVLKETKSADERRRKLLDMVKEKVKAVPEPVRATPDDVEAGLGLQWTAALQGDWWRALGTVPEPEIRRVLARMEASDEVFRDVFGLEMPREKGCGFYLLRGLPDAKLAIGKHPAFTDTQKAYYLTLRSAWLPHGKHIFFQWSDTPEVRVDGSVRNALGVMLMRCFGVNTDRGWVWEGLGCYLVELLTGSHRVIYVTRDLVTTADREPKLDIDKRMKQPGANWLALARELYDAKAAPELPVFTRKKVNDMAPEDLIAGYALARYIVEGRPDQATRFFTLHGNDQPIEETVKTVFRMPLGLFEQQITRWLKEMML
jgi:hypothetical protein